MPGQEWPLMTYHVSTYGVGASTRVRSLILNEELAVEAMRQRTWLWNQLVEIERSYINKRESLLEETAPSLKMAKASLSEEACQYIGFAMPRPVYKSLPEEQQKAWRSYQLTRRDVISGHDSLRELLADLTAERVALAKDAYRRSGLHWGNWTEILSNYERARKRPGDLHFHRFDGTGKVSARFSDGPPVPVIFANSGQFQIDPVPPEAYTHPSRGERTRLQQTRARVRIASNPDKSPVWFEVPIVLHRPLPSGRIRFASICRERIGLDWRYKLVVTVEVEDRPVVPKPGRVAIDIGWRKRPDGLRVATWVDGYGEGGTLVLSKRYVDGMRKTRDLESIRELGANQIRAQLMDWLRTAQDLPDWLREATAHISQWKKERRLWQLANRWRTQRFGGDETIWEELAAWRKREEHLYSYESHLRDQLIANRREQYRRFAAGLARYGTIVVEKMDLRVFAEDDDGYADWQRTLAGLHVLMGCIRNVAAREGLALEERDPAYTTRRCHLCGHVDDFDQAAEVVHKCSHCLESWDQDYNAAMNLLRAPQAPTYGASDPRVLAPVGA